MAWARGFQAVHPGAGAVKSEGDGRSPVGLFPITALFGYGAADPRMVPSPALPYIQATPDLKCVDDAASRHYNCLVDQSRVARDWDSCEDMLRQDGRYEIGAVVGYNDNPVVPGAGSCIFLHVWQGPGVPTAGCTALAREDMLALARWLDGGLSPVLVQLPRAVYRQVREDWGLPAVAG